jgi:cell division transport system permease protein
MVGITTGAVVNIILDPILIFICDLGVAGAGWATSISQAVSFLILLIISLFVIMNTIKLGVFARRNEVMFMRYCGATKAFIRTPFLVEGVIIGLFSAALSLGVEFLLYRYVLSGVVASVTTAISGGGIQLSPYANHLPVLAVLFCAVGLFAGLISGSISLKKYLKV